jgi:hypothetical protein
VYQHTLEFQPQPRRKAMDPLAIFMQIVAGAAVVLTAISAAAVFLTGNPDEVAGEQTG